MDQMAIDGRNHDPLRLRELLSRAESLASQHALSSVVVGMAGPEGDLIFPEVVDYLESALRVDDGDLVGNVPDRRPLRLSDSFEPIDDAMAGQHLFIIVPELIGQERRG